MRREYVSRAMCSNSTFLLRCLSKCRRRSSGVCLGRKYESLLAEGADLEAHLEDGEPLGDGRPQLAQDSVVHEVPVVH